MESNVQIEIDTSYLYKILASHERDPIISKVYQEMSTIEMSHAIKFAADSGPNYILPGPSWRAKTLHGIGKIFGYDSLLGVLMDTESSLAKSIF